MKGLEFPLIGSKTKGVTNKFDLNSPDGRKKYFQAKVGDEIEHIKAFLENKSFMAFLVGKKNSGKGTYAKLVAEIFGEDNIVHLSVGDLVREFETTWDEFEKSTEFVELKNSYRGFISFEDAVHAFKNRSTKTLLPTEFILALVKFRIKKLKGKSIFVDGLPRENDQVSYSLYFRDLAGYTDSPDLFILIDIAEEIIDQRIKYRVICPNCSTSRNLKTFVTSRAGFDEKTKEFFLLCDNPNCSGARMVKKEGDELGVGPIKERLDKDESILRSLFSLHGIPKVLLRNHVPVEDALNYFDEYEFTPEYGFKLNNGKVEITEKKWVIKDDSGVESYSLQAPAVVIPLIKQLKEALNL